ncbi:hypothetical protein L1987_20250 [Smallanthus sonchifolius]|uniref:Uncharacterized protein n=1 Tax=Smallanthus sonchifolius TaxID=185202 RepID=A0ACB9IRI3_9ASTR|nr:hypothetical protein L1987_20250 [Smallanthus sonchifolius]
MLVVWILLLRLLEPVGCWKKNVAGEKDIVVKKDGVEEKEVSGKKDGGKKEAVAKPKKTSAKGKGRKEASKLPLVEDGDSVYIPKRSVLKEDLLKKPSVCRIRMPCLWGSTSNGFESWGPSSTLPHPSEEVFDHNLNGIEDFECTQMDGQTLGASEESSVPTKKRGEKRKDKETINSKIIEVGDNINEVAKMLIEKHQLSNDMDACMDKLETLGWE